MKKLVKRVDGMAISDDEEEPFSPRARLYHAPRFNLHIITILGCKTSVNPGVIIEGLKHTLINHPRFSSKLIIDNRNGGEMKWVRTKVNVEDHVIVPDLNTKMENPDKFIEDYISNMTTVPMDLSKPLWELHLLQVKTSVAESIGVFRIHHSIGDGASLISLLLACTRKMSDPEALPTLPVQKRIKESSVTYGRYFWWLLLSIWKAVSLIWNTTMDLVEFIATTVFLKDTKNPLIGEQYEVDDPQHAPKWRFVHRTFSLNDIKLVKNAMSMTVNDVLLGATQAGLSLYHNRSHGKQDRQVNCKSFILPQSNRFRAAVIFNIRPTLGIQASAEMMAKGSKVRLGNKIGYALLPLKFASQNDPLDYIREAKSKMDRKKNSLAAFCISLLAAFISKTFGDKAYAALTRRVLGNTSLTFSNVVGPTEEISFYGHPMTFLAPTVYGLPQALTIHFQSYVNKMIMVLAVNTNVIPDPHRLCGDIEESLQIIVDSVVAKGFIKD